MGLKDFLGLLQPNAGMGGDDAGGHHFAHQLLQAFLEAQVAVGQDTDQATVGDHWQARDAVALHDRERVGNFLFGMDSDRIGDHAALVLLHRGDFGGLALDGKITMDETESAHLRDRNRRARLGHRIHRARDERDTQTDVRSQHRRDVAARGQQVGSLRQQQHVIEGESLAKLRVRHWESPYAKKPAGLRGPSTILLNAAIGCSAIRYSNKMGLSNQFDQSHTAATVCKIARGCSGMRAYVSQARLRGIPPD